MDSSKVLSLIVLFYGLSFHYASASIGSLAEPYFDTVSLPPTTPAPLDISTSDAQLIFTLPLFTYVPKNVNYIMQNLGTYVSITAPSNSEPVIIGGVLGLVKYVLNEIVLSWNFMGSAASKVNGIGTPLEVVLFYRNSNYDTFDEAITFRDGVGIVSYRVPVIDGGEDSAAFDKFIPYLNAIVPDKATVSVPEDLTWDWFSKPFRLGYLSYAGAYVNATSKESYNCATVIVNPIINAHNISLAQFQSSFGMFSYSDPYPIQNSTGTPVLLTGPLIVF